MRRFHNFLGAGETPEEVVVGNDRAAALLRRHGVLPRQEVADGRSCPTCGAPLNTINDHQRGGWRYKCANGHRYGMKTNTFMWRVKSALGPAKVLEMLFLWLIGKNS